MSNWEKKFDEWYADPVSDPEVIKKVIRKALSQTQQTTISEIELLIVGEMLTANKEGQPTSRLTSLSIQLDKLKKEDK